jgi:predicted glycosyltransferase
LGPLGDFGQGVCDLIPTDRPASVVVAVIENVEQAVRATRLTTAAVATFADLANLNENPLLDDGHSMIAEPSPSQNTHAGDDKHRRCRRMGRSYYPGTRN